MVTQGYAIFSAVTKKSMAQPSKPYFETWTPSYRLKLRSCHPSSMTISEQLLALEAMDAFVTSQWAQMSREHSDGHAGLRELSGSHKEEHGKARERHLKT